MARGPVDIPFMKKVEVWQYWAEERINAAISADAQISEYAVKKLKNELSQYSYVKWRALDDYPEIQHLHSKYAEYSQQRREEEALKSWQSTDIAQKLINISEFKHMVSSCLYNPHTEICTELKDWKPLHYEGYDYRLEPMAWFHLCTPDFSEESYWQPIYFEMINYLKEIGFWDHYIELQGKVSALRDTYMATTDTISYKEKEFYRIWEQIEAKTKSRSGPSRIPADTTPDLEECAPYCNPEQSEMVTGVFAKHIADLFQKQCNLEQLLQELNNDLLKSNYDATQKITPHPPLAP